MPRQDTPTIEEPVDEQLSENGTAPISESEGFYEQQIKTLLPAMMAHAGSITSHSPACEKAFHAILGKQNAIPEYGVYKEPTRQRRSRTEQEESGEGMRF